MLVRPIDLPFGVMVTWPPPTRWWALALLVVLVAALAHGGRQRSVAGLGLAALTAAPKPFPHACYNLAAIHLRRADPASTANEGQRALAAGCPPIAELSSPMAVGLAVTGRWDEAEAPAERPTHAPTGKAIVVRLVAAARRGELVPARDMEPDSVAGRPLAEQVAWLLERSGKGETAARLRERAERSPPVTPP